MQFIKFITTEIFIKSNIYIYLVGIGDCIYMHRYWYKFHFLFLAYFRYKSKFKCYNNLSQFKYPPKNWTKTSIWLIHITFAQKHKGIVYAR